MVLMTQLFVVVVVFGGYTSSDAQVLLLAGLDTHMGCQEVVGW